MSNMARPIDKPSIPVPTSRFILLPSLLIRFALEKPVVSDYLTHRQVSTPYT